MCVNATDFVHNLGVALIGMASWSSDLLAGPIDVACVGVSVPLPLVTFDL